ncbi:hypothetical protein CR513_36492, partial [Mucuna pruriens]
MSKGGTSWKLKSTYPAKREMVTILLKQANNIGFAKKPNQDKKKGEANVVLLESVLPYGRGKPPPPYPTQIHCFPPYQLQYQPMIDNRVVASSNSMRPAQQNFRRSILRMLALIPMSYTELLPLILQNNLIATIPRDPSNPHIPKAMVPTPNAIFMVGLLDTLQKNVQDLIDVGWFDFQERGPNVNNNPLPAHGGTSINAIGHECWEEKPEEAQ